MGLPEKANIYAQKILDLSRKLYSKESKEYLSSLLKIIQTYENKSKKLEEFEIEAMRISKKISDKKNTYHADCLKSLAYNYHRKSAHMLDISFGKALKYYNQALKIYQKKLGKANRHYVDTLLQLAILHRQQKRKGFEYNRKVLRFAKILYEETPLYQVPYMVNFAIYYLFSQKNPIRAHPFLQQALKLIEKNMGKQNLEYAHILALIAIEKKQVTEYLQIHKKNKKLPQNIQKQMLLKYPILKNTKQLKVLSQGKSYKDIYQNAMNIRKKIVGEKSLLYAIYKANYAFRCYYPDNIEKAIELTRQSQRVLERILRKKHILLFIMESRLKMYKQIENIIR